MKRHLVNLRMALALLLCVGSLALWVCGLRGRSAEVSVRGRVWEVAARDGRLWFTDAPLIELDKQKLLAESGPTYNAYNRIIELQMASRFHRQTRWRARSRPCPRPRPDPAGPPGEDGRLGRPRHGAAKGQAGRAVDPARALCPRLGSDVIRGRDRLGAPPRTAAGGALPLRLRPPRHAGPMPGVRRRCGTGHLSPSPPRNSFTTSSAGSRCTRGPTHCSSWCFSIASDGGISIRQPGNARMNATAASREPSGPSHVH